MGFWTRRYTHDVGGALLGRVLDVKTDATVREFRFCSEKIYRQLRDKSVESIDATWIRRTRAYPNQKIAEEKAIRFNIFRLEYKY